MKILARALALTLLALCAPAVAAGPERPNVVLIIVDDLRPELPTWGQEGVHAPAIEALAARGVAFLDAYVNVPVCGASRASFLTGLRPTPERFVDFDARADEDAPGAETLPGWFKRHGYHTTSLGKVFHHLDDSPQSWSEPAWEPNGAVPKARRTGFRDYQSPENIRAFREDGAGPATESLDVADDAYFDGQIANRAVEALAQRAAAAEPFFLAVGFVKPHLPFTAPRRYWDLYDPATLPGAVPPAMPPGMPAAATHGWGELRRYSDIPDTPPTPVSTDKARQLRHGYYAAISYADAQVGKVLGALAELGLEDDTVVMLVGDHGWSLGEHGLWAKHSTFDVATHAPLIVAGPDITGGALTTGLAEFVDLYPTLVELAGLPAPPHLQGRSLKPQLDDAGAPGADAVFPRWKSGEAIKTRGHAMTIWYGDDGKPRGGMLFDHDSDRPETVNLYEREELQPLKLELQDRIERLRESR